MRATAHKKKQIFARILEVLSNLPVSLVELFP